MLFSLILHLVYCWLQIAPSRIKIARVQAGSVLVVILISDSEPTAPPDDTSNSTHIEDQEQRIADLAAEVAALAYSNITAFSFGYELEAFKLDVFVPTETLGDLGSNSTNGSITFLGTPADFIIAPSPSPTSSQRAPGSSYVFGSLGGTVAVAVGIAAVAVLLVVVSLVTIRRRQRIAM